MALFVENAPEQVLATAKELLGKGLVEGTAGNVSARQEDGNVAITPSSLDYRDMTVDDIVIIDPEGNVVRGQRSPSSEKLLHLGALNAFDDIACVIHSHAVYATMFAVAHQDIPACIDEFAVFVGGDIRCTDYATSGSVELSQQAVKALQGRSAALIANHGMVATGPSLAKALHITALVERNAQIVWGARQLGPIHPLPEEVEQKFAGYYQFMRTTP